MNNNIETNKKNDCFWKMFAMFLLGAIVGFVFAPIKKGVKVCCDNYDSMNAYGKDDEDENEESDFGEGIPF